MAKLESLQDALLEELKDIYSAENQLLKALPKMAKKASNQTLKEAFNSHLEETQGQIERLDEISKIIGKKLSGKACKAMQGLIEEGKELLEEESENEAVLDALLIGAAQRVEHYEISAYGTARAIAQQLGENEIAKLLDETLDEESATDEKLTAISEKEVLPEAMEASESEEEEEEEQPARKSPASRGKSSSKRGSASKAMALAAFLLLPPLHSGIANADTREEASNEKEASLYEADNTGRNVRDRNEERVTADDQDLSGDQNQTLAKIRRAITSDDSFSTSAKNVKILIENGVVTLRGPVASAEEKQRISAIASRQASKYKVNNLLEVAAG